MRCRRRSTERIAPDGMGTGTGTGTGNEGGWNDGEATEKYLVVLGF